eukprot:TRINITY_DN332_c1_g2_i1.p1 TRINITY_DN332_c1_g2~~TRINITY_DN332_c1_g2_i1.p1  ORF type:complete len:554 (+),score=90.87 TRINITY_DN332_c1_g2_i1:74-1735(+)
MIGAMSNPISASQQFFMLSVLSLQVCPALAGLSGTTFLGKRDLVDALAARGPADLLVELEQLSNNTELDHLDVISARTPRLEAALMPLYRISPKDAQGNLNVKAARYVLHRLFQERHGWFVNGIGLHAGFKSTSRVGEALYSSSSYSIHQLARFAATVETLAHSENIERLQQAFLAYGLSKKSRYDKDAATTILNAYMAYFLTIVRTNLSFQDRVALCESHMVEWPDTKVFVREIQQKVLEDDGMSGQPTLLWDFTLKVVDEIGERYGRWQDTGCTRLKTKLAEFETPGTGRVPITKFWSGRAQGIFQWPFAESIPYLEQLGALDGNEGSQPSVLIANYVQSATNCAAGSKYYDVCCLNECESLLGQIEVQVDSPRASSKYLLELVSKLPSSTVDAPRVLPASLAKRLELVAQQQNGSVILHSRLFAQFLHHAYPRECPYPYLSVSQNVSSEWKKRLTKGTTVTPDEAAAYLKLAAAESDTPVEASSELPWTDEEDFFMHSLIDEEPAEASMQMPFVVALIVGCAAAIRFWQPLASSLGVGQGSKASETHYYI